MLNPFAVKKEKLSIPFRAISCLIILKINTMAKSQDAKKTVKKEATMSLKEKRAAKAAKRAAKK